MALLFALGLRMIFFLAIATARFRATTGAGAVRISTS